MSAVPNTVFSGCALIFVSTFVCVWLIRDARRKAKEEGARDSNALMFLQSSLIVIAGYGTELALNTHGMRKILILLSYLCGIGLPFLLRRLQKS